MQKITTLFVFLFLSSAFTFSQDVVAWDFSLEDAGNGEVNIIANASVDEGWYMYEYCHESGIQSHFLRVAHHLCLLLHWGVRAGAPGIVDQQDGQQGG